MSEVNTFSFPRALPLRKALQMFIDMWAKDEDYIERNEAINVLAELMAQNENPTEYVATFRTSRQISEDSWDVFNPSLKIDSNTKVSDIENFFRKEDKVSPLEVKIIQLQSK